MDMTGSRLVSRSAVARSASTLISTASDCQAGLKPSWRHSVSATALLLGLFAVPASAFAQAASGPTIGEVVVTAQKREENLQDVPVAITAFTAETRDRTGLVSAQQQLNFTPGVNYFPG